MLKFVLASRNRKKIRELETFLSAISSDIQILSLDDIGYTDEIVEDGATFAENSLIKARVPASLGYVGVADDSGLEVDALGGAPGVYSARWSGEGATDEKNNAKLLDELRDVPADKRTARFKTVVTCAFPDGKYFQCDGVCEGTLLTAPDGDGGFGYDPLFWSNELGRSFGAASADEKNHVSHRARAMRRLAELLPQYLDKQSTR